MADSFECPACGKAYLRENRLVGKAVVCECGRRFLAPPPAEATPRPSASPPPMARPVANAAPAAATPLPGVKKPLKAVLPASPQAKPARWADPLPSNEPLTLTEADLIDDGAPLHSAPSAPPSAILVAASPAIERGSPIGSTPARATYAPPRIKTLNDIHSHSTRNGAANTKRWAAFLVFFLVLLLAGLLVLAVMLIKR